MDIDIILGNDLISKYMGYHCESFHSDWNSLMHVIRKISKIDPIYHDAILKSISDRNFEIFPIWEDIVEHCKIKLDTSDDTNIKMLKFLKWLKDNNII